MPPNLIHEAWNFLSWTLYWKIILQPAYRWIMLIWSIVIFLVLNLKFSHEFIKICRKMNYSSEQVKTIDVVILSYFSTDTSSICMEVGNRLVESMYYLSGWTIVFLGRLLIEEMKRRLYVFVISVIFVGQLGALRGMHVFQQVKLIG